MHRFCNNIKTIALASLVQLFLLNVAAAAEDGQQAEEDLQQVNSAIEEIQNWLVDANARQSQEQQVLRAAEIEIAELGPAVAALTTSVHQTQSELNSLRQRNDRLQAEKAEQNEVLAVAIRAAYMTGEQNLLKLLLNQQDIAESGRMLHYSRVFSESQLQKIAAFQYTLDELAVLGIALESTLSDLNRQQTALDQQVLALNEARTARQQAIAELNASIANRSSELEQLEIDQAELQALIEEINRALEQVQSVAALAPFTDQRGSLNLPASGSIVSRFGSRYGEGSLTRQGITIAAAEGTAVQSVHAGRVVFADWLRGSGLLVIVDHGDGYMSLYGSNQALAKQAGDWVEANETLATSGLAGDGSAGVYFEIRHHGEAQNPMPWFREN